MKKNNKKKYLFMGMVLKDGDKFVVQVEKPGTSKYNPSGKATYTFHPESYLGVKEYMPKKKYHKWILVPREKIIMGGPMNVFIRCKNKGCVAGVDFCSLESPEFLLGHWTAKLEDKKDCPYQP